MVSGDRPISPAASRTPIASSRSDSLATGAYYHTRHRCCGHLSEVSPGAERFGPAEDGSLLALQVAAATGASPAGPTFAKWSCEKSAGDGHVLVRDARQDQRPHPAVPG
jgi:hypothetical protein